jgi:hypothetical protein
MACKGSGVRVPLAPPLVDERMTEDVIGSAVGYVLQDGGRAGHGVRWAACDGESETLTDRRRTDVFIVPTQRGTGIAASGGPVQ